jgi:hypothetical protein
MFWKLREAPVTGIRSLLLAAHNPTAFLTLFLKVFSLEGKDASKAAGNWCQLLINFGVVAKALRYKPAGCGFDSRWCNWNFSVT